MPARVWYLAKKSQQQLGEKIAEKLVMKFTCVTGQKLLPVIFVVLWCTLYGNQILPGLFFHAGISNLLACQANDAFMEQASISN